MKRDSDMSEIEKNAKRDKIVVFSSNCSPLSKSSRDEFHVVKTFVIRSSCWPGVVVFFRYSQTAGDVAAGEQETKGLLFIHPRHHYH